MTQKPFPEPSDEMGHGYLSIGWGEEARPGDDVIIDRTFTISELKALYEWIGRYLEWSEQSENETKVV